MRRKVRNFASRKPILIGGSAAEENSNSRVKNKDKKRQLQREEQEENERRNSKYKQKKLVKNKAKQIPKDVRERKDSKEEPLEVENPVPIKVPENLERSFANLRPGFLQRLASRLYFVKYVILVLILPPILNYAALQREASVLVPEGDRVDMGWGQKMFIHCEGEGLPTVILDAPNGMTSDVWTLAISQISKISKVCVYDRSGLGFSDLPFTDLPAESIQQQNRKFVAQTSTLDQMTSDLHYLVHEAKPLSHPFILVGSEVGALVSRLYAHMYPKDVSDIILIDPFVENLFANSDDWKNYWYSSLLPSFQSLHLSAVLGLSRLALLTGFLQPWMRGFSIPEEVILRQKYHLCNPSHMNSVFNEHLYINTSFSQIRNAWKSRPFPDSISVTVISTNYSGKYPIHLQKAWQESQRYLHHILHPGSSHKVHEGEDCFALFTRPRFLIAQIRYLVQRWRFRNGVLPAYMD